MNNAKVNSFNNNRSFNNSSNIIKKGSQAPNNMANALRFRRQFITQKNQQLTQAPSGPNGLTIQTGQNSNSNAGRDISNQRDNPRMASNGNREGSIKHSNHSQNTRTTQNPLVSKTV